MSSEKPDIAPECSDSAAKDQKCLRFVLVWKPDSRSWWEYYRCRTQPRQFIAWHQGQPGQDLGDGIKIVRFVVETDRGMCYAYFHPKWSVLFDMVAKGDPIAQVPTEMVVAHVQRATGQNLLDVLQR